MTFQDWLLTVGQRIQESTALRYAVSTATFLLLLLVALFLVFLLTYSIKIFFKHHPLVNRAHRAVVYLLTMVGVLVLLSGALVGAMMPLIPGLVFLFFALLLLRKYHRNEWLDNRFRSVAHILHIKIEQHKLRRAERKRIRAERIAERKRQREERIRQKLQEMQEKV